MTEKRVSVRLAAVGGDKLRAEFTAVGRAGREAMDGIAGASGTAAAGLGQVGTATGAALGQMEALAARATRAAAALRAAGASTGSLVERIDAATGVTAARPRDGAEIAAYGAALDDLRARHNPLFATIRDYKARLAEIRGAQQVGAISADEMSAAISRERQAALGSIAALKGRAGALEAVAGSSKMAAFQSRVLLFQLNDVFVSLASGMSPLMVLVQQGSQISQIYGPGEGGIGRAFRETGSMIGRVLTRFPLVTAVVGAGALALAGLTLEVNRASDVTVGYGDVALATWGVIRDGLLGVLKPAIDAIVPWFTAAWDAVVAGVKTVGNAIINGFRAAFASVRAIWGQLDDIVGAAAVGSANALIAGLEAGVNQSIRLLNGLSEQISAVLAQIPGIGEVLRIPQIAPLQIGRIDNPYAESVREGAAALRADLGAIFASDPLGDFFEAIRTRAVAAVRAREAAEGGARGPGARSGGRSGSGNTDGPAAPDLAETADAARRAGEALRTAAEDARPAWDAVNSSLETTGGALDGLAEDLTGPLKQFLKSGELSWRGFADAVAGIARSLADRLITQAFQPIEEALTATLARVLSGLSGSASGGSAGGGLGGGILKALVGAAASAFGGYFGGGATPIASPGLGTGGLYARGGAFDRAGEITAFARGGVLGGGVGGGLVRRPTVFPFAGGIGLMGEAGPEAILPLRRGPGGRLGVEAGTGAGSAPAPATRIINVLDPAIVGDYLATSAGERAIVNVIRRNRGILDG